MDIPRSFDDKCALLVQMFDDSIVPTIEVNERSTRIWEHCLRHPTLSVNMNVVLVFGAEAKEAEHRRSFAMLDNFARYLTKITWAFRSHELNVLREAVHQERRDPFLVVTIQTSERSTAMVHVPATKPRVRIAKKFEISANDRRFLRSLRISSGEETNQTEVE